MHDRYRMFHRAGGTFYARDKVTDKGESLKTKDKAAARQLLVAMNQAVAQPQLNRSLAKAYLSAKSPELLTRTWADVMHHYVVTGVESTRDRKERCFRSRPFAMLRTLKLVDTEAIHILTIIEHKQAGNSTHHHLRRLHNYALHLGWLLAPIVADAVWPTIRKRKFTAITEEEHERIIAREQNVERRLYYQMLWETGGSQTDIACLHWDQADLKQGVIRFSRRKLVSRDGGDSLLRIGPRISAILSQLPQKGYLFPTFKDEKSNHRSIEFWRRCKTLGIKGRNLHSYRYAWAQRARAAGMPEREAMNHLGHKSRAIHAAYADGAQVAVMPLEFYEAQREEKVIQFRQVAQQTAPEQAKEKREVTKANRQNRPCDSATGDALVAAAAYRAKSANDHHHDGPTARKITTNHDKKAFCFPTAPSFGF